MAGFHNQRIYTVNDNPWCKNCVNGELIKGFGNKLLKRTIEAYWCHCGGIPTKNKCNKYKK